MPRILRKRKQPLKTAEKVARERKWNPKGWTDWFDPYPYVQGTRPEKMVYAYLQDIGIPFLFQTRIDVSKPSTGLFKWLRPDFVIPSLNLIVEVQGSYWHSSPDQVTDDRLKEFIYELAGYKVLYIWDYELETSHPAILFRDYPAISNYQGAKVGEQITKYKQVIDDSAGVRKANALRKDYAKHVARIKTRKTRSKSAGLSYINYGQ